MTSTVRRATVADAPALAELRWQWLVELGYAGDDREAFGAAFAEWFAGNAPTHHAYLAMEAAAPVGMAWLAVLDRVPTPARPRRRNGDVQAVYVVPELRDAGVGATLLTAVLGDARRFGLEHVTVHSSGRAITLYQRMGFRMSAERPPSGPIRGGSTTVRAVDGWRRGGWRIDHRVRT